MARQFLEFKDRTLHVMDTNLELKEKLKLTECALALKYPVDDFDTVFPEENPLTLYDCLMPEIRKNRQARLGAKANGDADDMLLEYKIHKMIKQSESVSISLLL